MLKRWFSIKEIEVYLLCEILISKDTLQGQKNCCEPPFKRRVISLHKGLKGPEIFYYFKNHVSRAGKQYF